MKVKLLRKIRKHLHVKARYSSSTYDRRIIFEVYSKDFLECIRVGYFRKPWRAVVGKFWWDLKVWPWMSDVFGIYRIKRDNKAAFKRN